MRRFPNAGSMLGHRLQRWPSVRPTLERLLSAGSRDKLDLGNTLSQIAYQVKTDYKWDH